jgi:TonB-linked SusC/RagA family outer membrane protein
MNLLNKNRRPEINMRPAPKRILFIMKLTTLAMIIFSVNISATVYSQRTKLSLEIHNQSIKEVLFRIESLSEFRFVYENEQINLDRKVSIRVKKQTVETILNQLLSGENVKYEITESKTILLYPAEKPGTEEGGKDASVSAQQKRTVTGTVTDEKGDPVIGANVVEKGSVNGTVTDVDGNFSLTVPDNAVLQISYIGYLSQEIAIENQNHIRIILPEDLKTLEEVVVVGYGTQKKINLTGAVSQVSSKVLMNRPITNLSQGLQGVIPNLNVTFPDGNPSTEAQLNVRGIATIRDNDNSEPLILVDGVQMNLNMLNPEDIESISVLKDAASSAIYGARGAFGVILVTTKRGQTERKSTIEYSGGIQLNTQSYLPEMLNAVDYMNASNESSFNQSGKNKYTDDQVKWVKDYQADPVNNPVYHMLENGNIFWNGGSDNFKQMLQKWAPTNKHTLSINGGTKQIGFYASVGYMGQEGVFKDYTDVFKRYNFLANVTANITETFRIGLKSSYSQTAYDEPHKYPNKGASWWEQLTRGEPQVLFPVYTPADSPVGEGVPTEHFYNFLSSGSRKFSRKEAAVFLINGEWDIFKGMKFKGDFSYHTTNFHSKDVQKEFEYIRDSWTSQVSATYPSFMETNSQHTDYFAGNIYADYNVAIHGGHRIGGVAGFNQEWETYRGEFIRKEELISMEIPSINLGVGNTNTSDREYSWAIRGAFFRLNYDYQGKYLLEVDGRYDGTSKFPHEFRFGFFPSFSAGWRISQEKFLNSTGRWLSDLKLRVSYGSLGNQNVKDYYPYISTFEVTQRTGYIINGNLPVSVSAPGLVASDLSWETTNTFNLGLDILLLDKLSANFDWYERRTVNMLTVGEKLPSVIGTSVPQRNNADMKTSGFELSVKWSDRLKNGLNYDIGFILSDYKSVITRFDNNPSKLYDNYYAGKVLGEIWGYETAGIFQTPEEVASAAGQSKLGNGDKWGPGDVHYADLNKDNVIDWGDATVGNPGDTKIIGNSTPRFQFGITGNVEWKRFDFNLFIQGVGKRDFMPSGSFFWGHIENGVAVGTYEVYRNAWRPENPQALYPIWEAGSSGFNARPQTRFLQSGTYARLKNLTLGYTLPSSLASRIALNRIRVYFAGQNLCEITKIRGNFDPEIIGNVGEYYPLQRSVLFGIQITL